MQTFTTTPPSAGASTIVVTLTADRTVIRRGESILLNWQASDASSCTASGGWSGARGISGTETISGMPSSSDFHLSCTGVSGSGSLASVNVRVVADEPVAIEFGATPTKVDENGHSTLVWKATNATACVSTGDWSGDRAVEGQFDTGPLTRSVSYTLRCDNSSFQQIATVTVGISGTRIEWAPPQLNEDGTPAEDIAGYKVYWGRNPAALDSSTEIIPGTQTWWEPDLPSGEYYFAISAFDSRMQESDASEPFRKRIP